LAFPNGSVLRSEKTLTNHKCTYEKNLILEFLIFVLVMKLFYQSHLILISPRKFKKLGIRRELEAETAKPQTFIFSLKIFILK